MIDGVKLNRLNRLNYLQFSPWIAECIKQNRMIRFHWIILFVRRENIQILHAMLHVIYHYGVDLTT